MLRQTHFHKNFLKFKFVHILTNVVLEVPRHLKLKYLALVGPRMKALSITALSNTTIRITMKPHNQYKRH